MTYYTSGAGLVRRSHNTKQAAMERAQQWVIGKSEICAEVFLGEKLIMRYWWARGFGLQYLEY